MTIIVEDGSIVTNANSYVTRAEFIAYAASVGVTIGDATGVTPYWITADIQLINAAIYLDSKEPQLKGTRTDRDQPLAYPRTDLVLEGFEWESDEIPRQVILCQMALALDINAGEDLFNRSSTLPTIRERVDGAVEVAYANPNVVGKVSTKSRATALLSVLMKRDGMYSIEAMRA